MDRAHSNKFFSGCWMNANCRVKLFFRDSHTHRDTESLHNFPGSVSNHMHSNNFVRRCCYDNFHERLVCGSRNPVFEWSKFGLIHFDSTKDFASLLLGETTSSKIRIGEHSSCDEFPVRTPDQPSELSIRKAMSLVEGDWSQLHRWSAIPNGKNIFHTGSLPFIHGDVALLHCNTNFFKPKSGRFRHTSGCAHYLIGDHRLAGVKRYF
mmetsp:Transcript_25880/g.62348  ORF Transcript_25880/g.62348 Transcript_25880/m.62348 type:complete len:208 (+) Transcript_25880:500-1123(+)